MVLINKSSDDTAEASNAGSPTGPGSEIVAGSRITARLGTAAGSPPSIVAPADHAIIDINQPNIPGERELENVMAMLEWAARGLGKLVIGWVMAMLQGGFADTLQIKDFVFVALTVLFVAIRIFCGNHEHNMQQLTLFYWFQLVSAMTTGMLSAMQLYSQDFGQTEEAYKAKRDFALNFFYVMALAQALLLLAEKAIRKWRRGSEYRVQPRPI